jgi:hypothetical protein
MQPGVVAAIGTGERLQQTPAHLFPWRGGLRALRSNAQVHDN